MADANAATQARALTYPFIFLLTNCLTHLLSAKAPAVRALLEFLQAHADGALDAAAMAAKNRIF